MDHKDSKRIVITANTSWYLFNFRMGLLKELIRQDFSVYAVAPKDEYVRPLENLGIIFYDLKINSKGTNFTEDIFIIRDYIKIFKKIKPHLILSNTIKPNIYGNFAAQFLKIPVINTVSGLGTIFIKKTFSSYIGRLLYFISFHKTNWVFFQNSTDRDLFIQGRLVNCKFSSVIAGSGVDTHKFYFNRSANKGKVFLFAGRLLGDKGIREYIEAAKKIIKADNSITFIIIGELGSNNNTAISSVELNEWLENPQIIYKGKTNDIISELIKADVMVLPSYREGLSKSLIEAAAMKLPIITTNVPGCRDVVIHGQNGYLCKVKDSDDLYLKMIEMIKLTETERIEMGEFGRNIAVNKFDEKIVISHYLEKIALLVKN